MSWDDYADVIFSNLHLAALVTGIAVGSAATHWLWSTLPKRIPAIVDLDKQTRQLSDGSRVAACLKTDELMAEFSEDVRTLYDVARRGMRMSNNGPMLGWRQKQNDGTEPYVWLSYKQALDSAEEIAYGLRKIGIECGQKTFAGILMRNRPEWTICELAVYCNNSIVVPVYGTFGVYACDYIINETQMNVIFVDNERVAMDLLEREHLSLQHIVIVDHFSDEPHDELKRGVSLWSLKALKQLGQQTKNDQKLQLPTADDVCTVSYTSGATGIPKGAVLTHRNVIACCTVLLFFRKAPFLSTDTLFSFLPLAHVMQRLVETMAFAVGMRVGYFRGDMKTLFDDISELKPTIFLCVPRILNKIYEKAINEANMSFFSKYIFKVALAYKMMEVRNGVIRNSTIVDKLVFKNLQETIGGRVKLIITGSAPVSSEVLQFARAAFGCVVQQGYGQTECSCVISLCIDADISDSNVGIPICCNAVKLVDVPELGYFEAQKAGEICVRGANVFKGYFKDEAKTKSVIDDEGWLHTGDVGEWTEQGTLRIIGRITSIFKLSQGEHIAPERIESVYLRSKFVSQIFVHGESLKSCIVAIVVPDIKAINNWSHKRFGITMSAIKLCASQEIKNLVLSDMERLSIDAGLCSFEKVKDIYLTPEAFSVHNDQLTSTLKLRRRKLQEHYSKQLAQIYSKFS
ncbi:Long-chain-fatty-acid--CoA ligase 1 [Toxocara canis]|uniref:long-chain-fatty-acid--CoA ligase n=1 Tax=Toxocara canis TaxID=6265 RepID=A0A0B2VMG2_TOXCA|nr:Long-chain-fatty-acid--CoA ligase 1 [Toxocara canis]